MIRSSKTRAVVLGGNVWRWVLLSQLLVATTLGCRETAARPAAERRSPPPAFTIPRPLSSGLSPEGSVPTDAVVSELATLKAKNALGVPLHSSPGSNSVSARLPDGARVRILAVEQNGRWLKIRGPAGVEGWVTRRYVRDSSGASAPRSRGLAVDSPWASRAACLNAVANGVRLKRAEGRARVVAWNLRWFPDATPGYRAGSQPTDIEWLACAITFLDADVLALSEIKGHPRGKQKLLELLQLLGQRQNATWDARLDDCKPDVAQHVGLAWNTRRVRAKDLTVVGELNPHGAACAGQLRPGFGARLEFPGGLDLALVSVHFKSGGQRRAFELRKKTFTALPSVLEGFVGRYRDEDLLVLGDFNTMGCPDCSPKSSAESEQGELSVELMRMPKPMLLLPSQPKCSHYFSGKAGLLDLAVASKSMAELGPAPSAIASGFCGELSCQSLPEGGPLEVQRALSDHCPIVFDLIDKDLDPP